MKQEQHIKQLTKMPRLAAEGATLQHKISFGQDLLGAMNTFLDNKDADNVITDEPGT
jgi:hypothetical protein